MTAPLYNYTAEVVRWVDGDTVDLRVDLGFRMFAETRFRLYGVDTPERGQPNYHEASEFCESVAPLGSEVLISTYKDADKYGRWLVVIHPTGTASINDQLVQRGLAVEYFGGKKGA